MFQDASHNTTTSQESDTCDNIPRDSMGYSIVSVPEHIYLGIVEGPNDDVSNSWHEYCINKSIPNSGQH